MLATVKLLNEINIVKMKKLPSNIIGEIFSWLIPKNNITFKYVNVYTEDCRFENIIQIDYNKYYIAYDNNCEMIKKLAKYNILLFRKKVNKKFSYYLVKEQIIFECNLCNRNNCYSRFCRGTNNKIIKNSSIYIGNNLLQALLYFHTIDHI